MTSELELLEQLTAAVRSGGVGGKTTAKDVRTILPSPTIEPTYVPVAGTLPLDEVRVWNVAKTAEDIATEAFLRSSALYPASGPTFLLSFDEPDHRDASS